MRCDEWRAGRRVIVVGAGLLATSLWVPLPAGAAGPPKATAQTQAPKESGTGTSTGSTAEGAGGVGVNAPEWMSPLCSYPGPYGTNIQAGADTCTVVVPIAISAVPLPYPLACPVAYRMEIDARGNEDRCFLIKKATASVDGVGGTKIQDAVESGGPASSSPGTAPPDTAKACKTPAQCRPNEVCRDGRCRPKS